MATTSNLVRLHGGAQPLQKLRPLRAGPLTAALDGVDLRYVRLGDVELARRIYVAVRDRNWNTIPGVHSAVEVDQRDDTFAVTFSVRHTGDDTDFFWQGSITGGADGRIRFAMDGQAERPMLFNRIGFCVLHPWRESAGRRYRGETPDGPVEGELPRLVAPQRFEDGVYVPLFPSVSRLEIDLEAGGDVVFEFEGDLFETEDHRNWTDASLKTYCTPLALGFPHELGEGERRSQSVTLHPRNFSAPLPGAERARATVSVGGPTGARVCAVGLGLPDGGARTTAGEAELLRGLGAAHVRHELHLNQRQWRAELTAALAAAAALEAQLELALFVAAEQSPEDLAAVSDALAGAALARVLVAIEDAQTATAEETTPGEVVARVRDGLGLGGAVPVAGGTDMYFCELNRTRPEVDRMDGVFWSMNGQVHAFDDISVMETPEAQGEQVRTARGFAGAKPLFVGPVTLKRRYNVNATVAEGDEEDEMPDSVDPRQASLLAAAWTLASVKHVAEQGAAAVTYFQTAGWLGVIQGDLDPPLPDRFPARAGSAFPLFHVLTDFCELRGAEVLRCEGASPLDLAAIAVRAENGSVTLLMANLTPRDLRVGLDGIPAQARVRRLNESTAEQAMLEPVRFRARARREAVGDFMLAAYETVRIDTQP